MGPASDHSVLLQHHVRCFAFRTADYLWGTFHPFTFCGPLNLNSGGGVSQKSLGERQHHTIHTNTHTQQHFRVSNQLDVHVSFDSGMKLKNLCNMWNIWNIWNMYMSVRADSESVKMFDFYCRHVSPCCVFITSCGQMCVGVSTEKGELYLFPTQKNKPNIS